MGPARKTRARRRTPREVVVANAERGEHELTLAGITYTLRPSHEALLAIETALDRSILALVRLGNAGELFLTQLGTLAAHLIRAGAEDQMTARVDAERLAELIQEEGIGKPTARITLCLLDAATGGCTATGERKAATATE